MIYPLKKIYITQDWGVNEDVYKRFGYKGHNGVDFRLFDKNGNKATTADLYAPHGGVVREAAYDPDGYGYYLKIENDKEGSILAHLQSFKVKVGDTVKESQLIGVCNNSGWSTGAHLHWGYYTLPRNRNNGYGGTINQVPLLEQGEGMSKELDACLKDRQKFWDERDELLRELNAESVEGGINTIRGLRSRITDLTNQVGTAQASQKNAEDKLSKQADEVIRTKEELNLCKSQMEQVKKSLNETMNDRNEIRDSLEKARLQIETLKQQQQQGEITLTIKDLITLIIQSKITIRRKS